MQSFLYAGDLLYHSNKSEDSVLKMHIWHFTLGGGSQLQLKVRGIALSSFSLFAVLLKLVCQFNWLSLGMFRMFRDDAENRSLEACEESMRLSCWHSSWVIKGRTLD